MEVASVDGLGRPSYEAIVPSQRRRAILTWLGTPVAEKRIRMVERRPQRVGELGIAVHVANHDQLTTIQLVLLHQVNTETRKRLTAKTANWERWVRAKSDLGDWKLK